MEVGDGGYDPAYGKYKCGMQLLFHAIRDLHAAGVRHVDFGVGEYDYKERLADRKFVESYPAIFSSRLRPLLLFAAFSAFARINRGLQWLVNRTGMRETLWGLRRRLLQARG